MRYEHDELFVLGADEEENDSHVPDSEQDIVPHASRGRHGVHDDGGVLCRYKKYRSVAKY
jgi:hypothetical protein